MAMRSASGGWSIAVRSAKTARPSSAEFAAAQAPLPDGRAPPATSPNRHRGVDCSMLLLATFAPQAGRASPIRGRRALRRAAYRGIEVPIDPRMPCYPADLLDTRRLSYPSAPGLTPTVQSASLHNIHVDMQLIAPCATHFLPDLAPCYHATHVRVAREQLWQSPASCDQAVRRKRLLKRANTSAGEEGIGYSATSPPAKYATRARS